jgi:hypothetical protein
VVDTESQQWGWGLSTWTSGAPSLLPPPLLPVFRLLLGGSRQLQ